MTPLLYFILGILCYNYIIPTIEQLFGYFMTAIELWKTKVGLKITQYNYKIQNVDNVPDHSFTIGFSVDDDQPEGEMEDDL